MHHARKYLQAVLLLAVAVHGGNALAQAQTLTTIHSFTDTNGDGFNPYASEHLPFDSNGALYGTTGAGGSTQAARYSNSYHPRSRAAPRCPTQDHQPQPGLRHG